MFCKITFVPLSFFFYTARCINTSLHVQACSLVRQVSTSAATKRHKLVSEIFLLLSLHKPTNIGKNDWICWCSNHSSQAFCVKIKVISSLFVIWIVK